MASRESQGLQIALIIFVMVTVVLAVMNFFFYRGSERLKSELASAQEKEKSARDSYSRQNFALQYLQAIVGLGEPRKLSEAEFEEVRKSAIADPEIKKIDDAFQKQVATFGEGLPPDRRNYHELLSNALLALQARNEANTDLTKKLEKLTADWEQLQKDEAQRTSEAIANQKKAESDLAARTKEFDDRRAALEASQTSQLDGLKKQVSKIQSELAAAIKLAEDRQKTIDQLEIKIETQRKKLEEGRRPSFERPDGHVTSINQAIRAVWINLGTADALRPQTQFSVYDQGESRVTEAKSKGSIEVTRVLREHLAEARIIADESSNPIMPGDLIFSPAWEPGQRVHFALAGLMDVDGDGRSDVDLVRNLIRSSGAVIDAEAATENGEETGALTSNTRYLVTGEQPTDAKGLVAWSKINEGAKQLGIEKINLKTLLNWIGYRREVRTVQLGEGIGTRGGSAAPAQEAGPGNASEAFQDRSPP